MEPPKGTLLPREWDSLAQAPASLAVLACMASWHFKVPWGLSQTQKYCGGVPAEILSEANPQHLAVNCIHARLLPRFPGNLVAMQKKKKKGLTS